MYPEATRTIDIPVTVAEGTADIVFASVSYALSTTTEIEFLRSNTTKGVTLTGNQFSHSITGYKRCGIGDLGCPESGTIVLERTKASGVSASVTIEFLGGREYTVTGPKGGKVTRALACIPS